MWPWVKSASPVDLQQRVTALEQQMVILLAAMGRLGVVVPLQAAPVPSQAAQTLGSSDPRAMSSRTAPPRKRTASDVQVLDRTARIALQASTPTAPPVSPAAPTDPKTDPASSAPQPPSPSSPDPTHDAR
jgi:hypothetical protein